jgi:methionyl-tRNA formyltransferase
MLLKREFPIAPEDTALTLSPKLAELGAKILVETLQGLEGGTVHPERQDDAQATLAPMLKKEDGQMDFRRTATDLWNRLRGFQPWPGAYTTFRGKKLNVTAARPMPAGSAMIDPRALRVHEGQLLVGSGQATALELLEVQPEGKKRMLAKDFINGYRPLDGEELGS